MRALDRKLIRDVWHLRTQILAVAAVVLCGVAALVALRSVYDSLVATRAAYYEAYRFADVFASLVRAPATVEDDIAAIPGVASVQTRVVMEVTLDVPGLDEPATGRIVSIPDRGDPELNRLFVEEGARPAPNGTAADDEVLISAAFAEENELQPGDTLSGVLGGRRRVLRVSGIGLSPEYVYAIRGAGSVFPDPRRFGVLWMREGAAAAAFDMEGAFNDVTLTLAPGASEPAVIEALDDILEPYGGLGAYGREDQISNRFISSEIDQNRVTSTIVPAIFVGVAAFLLNVLLSRLVATQRDQLAVLKAFGYGNLRVGAHYLGFALVPVALGAAIGTAIGLWLGSELTGVYARFYRFPVLVYAARPGVIALAIGVTGGAALLGAAAAVRGAVRLPPAEAMRPEPPARFRPGVLERLGLGRLFTVPGRIVMRQLERRPLRAAMAALGIALAVAILVVGRFFIDAVNHTIDVQFRTAQREDVMVVFEEAVPASARFELGRLPGVMRVEPFRSVAVRLRNGHIEYTTAIQGIDPEMELRRIVDSEGRILRMPIGGLILSTGLADRIQVDAGQRVRVEALEGSRPARRMRVTRTIDELVGVSAYMRSRDLNRFMGEQDAISGAYLAVDERYEDALYDRLTRLPAVAGVSIGEATLESFQETLAESLLISTTVLIVFAVVIAFGIVYNTARIALSERGRELATLRVLGFHRSEVATILLGEQAVVTLVAVPVGFVIGLAGATLVARAAASELYRLPVVVSGATYAFAFTVIAVAAVLSGWIVRRRLDRIDLVEVLKTRE